MKTLSPEVTWMQGKQEKRTHLGIPMSNEKINEESI